MITEYKRDMYHNYLVIHDENSNSSDYYEQVLKYNEITGHLKFESRIFDKEKYAYYEINGLQVLSSVFEKHTVRYLELKQIFKEIILGVNAGKEFLLKENDYVLSPNMIFFEIPKFLAKLCYFPGYNNSLRQQLHNLFEYFMNKVNYNDQAAVLLIYKLYMKSKDETCSMQQLLDILDENINIDASSKQTFDYKKELNQGVKCESVFENIKHVPLTVSYKEPVMGDKKDYNQSKKTQENKTNYKKGRMDELSKNVNQSINKVYQKLPFVTERVEGEKEVLYYPLCCYILSIGSVIVAIVLYVLAYKKRFIFQELKPSIDPLKSISLIIVLLIIVIYVCFKVFDKKHKVSKIVPKIDYIQPSLAVFENQEYNEELESPKNLEPLNLNSSNQELPKQEDVDEEERTVMLTDFTAKKVVKLIPVDKDIYDTIRLEEFPFFVGKLKTHTDVHIPSATISRFHAKIMKEDSKYFIMDLNSTNGTFVNGELVEGNEKRKIEDGNEITFANISYIFHSI